VGLLGEETSVVSARNPVSHRPVGSVVTISTEGSCVTVGPCVVNNVLASRTFERRLLDATTSVSMRVKSELGLLGSMCNNREFPSLSEICCCVVHVGRDHWRWWCRAGVLRPGYGLVEPWFCSRHRQKTRPPLEPVQLPV
jgi:hypothetical protein